MFGSAGDRSEHGERLVADLPAVAVGAVQEVAAPALARSGDRRQLVDGAGGEEEPARGQRAAVGEPHDEAAARPRPPRPSMSSTP